MNKKEARAAVFCYSDIKTAGLALFSWTERDSTLCFRRKETETIDQTCLLTREFEQAHFLGLCSECIS